MRRAPVASFTTMGQSKAAHLTERKNYTYKGTKPDLGPDADKAHAPNPKGGTPPDSHARKQEQLAKFRVALDELGGLDAPGRLSSRRAGRSGSVTGLPCSTGLNSAGSERRPTMPELSASRIGYRGTGLGGGSPLITLSRNYHHSGTP